MTHNHTHEAGADVPASDFKGSATVKHYPRLTVRRNSRGTFDAYLVKHLGAREVWVHAGATFGDSVSWIHPLPAPNLLAKAWDEGADFMSAGCWTETGEPGNPYAPAMRAHNGLVGA